MLDPRPAFVDLIDLSRSRVMLEPRIVFICGGPVDLKLMTNHSIRNMFMNLTGGRDSEVDGFVLAENFKDWQSGYKNLFEFENDIASLSSLVVIFLESAGALTELGLFFANEQLRSKLVVVMHEKLHNEESFIKFGLLNPMESKDQSTVKVYEIDHDKIEDVSKDEVKDILDDILEHCANKVKSEKFNKEDRGHQILLIYQIIDLFLSLTKNEIISHVKSLGLSCTSVELESALYILQKFDLIDVQKKSSQYFYSVPSGLSDRVDLNFKPKLNQSRFDKFTIKIEVKNFYNISAQYDPSHKRRMKVINNLIAEEAK